MPSPYLHLPNYPEGKNISGIVDDHLENILNGLRRRTVLPMPSELPEVVAEQCSIVIEEVVTIASLRRHLEEATEDTPEIGITIFNNGLQALEVGNTRRIWSDHKGSPFNRQCVIDFHTHPDPTRAQYMRHPSIQDLTHSMVLDRSIIIGSHDGLTYVPKLEVDHTGSALWRNYVTERGFDESSFDAYGPGRVYEEFITEIVRPHFIGWNALQSETPLAALVTS